MKCSVAKWNSLLVVPFLVVIACCIALALGPVSSYAAEAGDASSQTMAAAKGDVLGAQAKKASASKKKSPK